MCKRYGFIILVNEKQFTIGTKKLVISWDVKNGKRLKENII